MDESELMPMRRAKTATAVVEHEEQAIVALPAKPSTSASSSATLHPVPPGLFSSNSTAIGCKRARWSQNDSDSVTEDEEIDSRAWLMTALGGHGWTRR
jgi:hypothetical protein